METTGKFKKGDRVIPVQISSNADDEMRKEKIPYLGKVCTINYYMNWNTNWPYALINPNGEDINYFYTEEELAFKEASADDNGNYW